LDIHCGALYELQTPVARDIGLHTLESKVLRNSPIEKSVNDRLTNPDSMNYAIVSWLNGWPFFSVESSRRLSDNSNLKILTTIV
jgi:hypothetical protein